jgi:hypothetical protein
MNSPRQAHPKSAPKVVHCEPGRKIMQPMSKGRCTPATKTKAKIYAGTPKG